MTPAPREVSLSFTEGLEPTFSTVEVRDAEGARVDEGEAQVSGRTMRVGLKALPPGTYKVYLAGVVGRHAQDRGNLHVSGGKIIIEPGTDDRTCGDGRIAVNDPLIVVRAIHFIATMLAAGAVFFAAFVAEPAFREAASMDAPSPAFGSG